MSPVFYPTAMTPESLIRGPGRLLYASMSTAFPTQIGDVINLSTYASMPNWSDIGATKDGVAISFNNTEDTLDVDQVAADIATIPSGATMSVTTALSQATADWLSFAWEGDAVTTNVSPIVPEKNTGFGPFDTYTQRRLAVGYRRPDNGKLRLHAFRKAQRQPVDSTITFNKSGDQQTIPVAFTILPDTSISTVRQQFGLLFDQQ